jgi:arsenate reductase-like glutaredoxin family protein
VSKLLRSDTLTNSAIAAYMHCLDVLGLNQMARAKLKEWSNTHNVTLRLSASESCKFLRETVREVESDTKHVTTSILGTRKDYTVTKVKEYFWAFHFSYELVAYKATEVSEGMLLVMK